VNLNSSALKAICPITSPIDVIGLFFLIASYLEVVSKLSIRLKIKAGDGFKRRNIFNISSIEPHGPKQKMTLR
jgi:hypothetical protein